MTIREEQMGRQMGTCQGTVVSVLPIKAYRGSTVQIHSLTLAHDVSSSPRRLTQEYETDRLSRNVGN